MRKLSVKSYVDADGVDGRGGQVGGGVGRDETVTQGQKGRDQRAARIVGGQHGQLRGRGAEHRLGTLERGGRIEHGIAFDVVVDLGTVRVADRQLVGRLPLHAGDPAHAGVVALDDGDAVGGCGLRAGQRTLAMPADGA